METKLTLQDLKDLALMVLKSPQYREGPHWAVVAAHNLNKEINRITSEAPIKVDLDANAIAITPAQLDEVRLLAGAVHFTGPAGISAYAIPQKRMEVLRKVLKQGGSQ